MALERGLFVDGERYNIHNAFFKDAHNNIKPDRRPSATSTLWLAARFLINEYGVNRVPFNSNDRVVISLAGDFMSGDIIVCAGIGEPKPYIRIPKEGKVSYVIANEEINEDGKEKNPLPVMPYDQMELEVKLEQLQRSLKEASQKQLVTA